jgi:hypothetical protein
MTDLQLPNYFSFAEAMSRGISRKELARALDEGVLRRLKRGTYSTPLTTEAAERWVAIRTEHIDRLATELQRRPGHVGSHTTAAVVHGLAVTVAPASPVELTVVTGYQTSRREDGVVLHHADSTYAELVTVGGLRITSVDRTVADCLRTRRLPHGVALLDDALRRGLTTRERVLTALRAQIRWRGRPRALAALRLADVRRESWLESFSFVTLHERGLPMLVPQVVVLDEKDDFVGRTDGFLTRHGVFGEADGLGKYFLDADPFADGYAESVAAALEQEAERHEALERLGLLGVRWTGAEIQRSPELVVDRFVEAQRHATPARFRGRIVIDGTRYALPCDVRAPGLDERPLRYRKQRPRG